MSRSTGRTRRAVRRAAVAATAVAMLIATAGCVAAGSAGVRGAAHRGPADPVTSLSSGTGSGHARVTVPPIAPSAPASPATASAGTPSPSDPPDPSTHGTPPDPATATPDVSRHPSPMRIAGPAAHISTNVRSGAAINPITPVTVHATHGSLTAVHLVNPVEHRAVSGRFSQHHRSWTSTEVLGYGKDYRLSATAVNAHGEPTASHTDFGTITPDNQTLPSFRTIEGDPLADGGTFGVGMVVVVHFDEPISDRAAAQRTLHVTTSPHVAGAWNWVDDQDVHWRPRQFYRPGTTVAVAADVYGKDLGDGLFGQSDESVAFTIGRRQVTYAYDNAPDGVDKVVVKDGDGHTVRTMNTSMGKHGGVTVNGRYINFYTLDGTYTVIGHENPAMMSSASYGLPANAPGGYAPEPIYWSTRISTGGIYLHELDSTVWYQDHGEDVSHGCLNLNHDNAQWFYQHSLIGDPVIIKGAPGAPKIDIWEGGDWSVPWKSWLAGSALH